MTRPNDAVTPCAVAEEFRSSRRGNQKRAIRWDRPFLIQYPTVDAPAYLRRNTAKAHSAPANSKAIAPGSGTGIISWQNW